MDVPIFIKTGSGGFYLGVKAVGTWSWPLFHLVP